MHQPALQQAVLLIQSVVETDANGCKKNSWLEVSNQNV